MHKRTGDFHGFAILGVVKKEGLNGVPSGGKSWEIHAVFQFASVVVQVEIPRVDVSSRNHHFDRAVICTSKR